MPIGVDSAGISRVIRLVGGPGESRTIVRHLGSTDTSDGLEAVLRPAAGSRHDEANMAAIVGAQR